MPAMPITMVRRGPDGHQTHHGKDGAARRVDLADEFRPKVHAHKIQVENDRLDAAIDGKAHHESEQQQQTHISP
jgi:hypothetical protein